MNILVVDDEKEIADIVELYLKGDQYNIYKCYNGTDAWNLVQRIKFDMAILDVMLPAGIYEQGFASSAAAISGAVYEYHGKLILTLYFVKVVCYNIFC